MATQYTLIPCEVSPGQFSNEQAVTLLLSNGKKITLFADNNLIENKDRQSFLRVTKMDSKSNRSKGGEIVLLPTEAFENGSRWLRFTNNELVAA